MGNEQFSEEIDSLVDRGAATYDEFEIGIESFHHLRNIQRQFNFLKVTSIALAGFGLILSLAFVAVILAGGEGSNSTDNTNQSLSTAVVDTIEKIKAENRSLKEKTASLEKEIKVIRKQFLARGETNSSEYQTAKDNETGIAGTDSIIYHEVKKGETLFSIAEKYYGDGQMYQKIMSENNLTRQSDIYEGKQLKIHAHRKIR